MNPNPEREKVKVKYTPAYQTYHSVGDEAEPYCPKCDADLSYDEYNFCPWCGVELDWEPEMPTDNDDVSLDEFPFDTERECPECGGEGYDKVWSRAGDVDIERCSCCNGSGKVSES